MKLIILSVTTLNNFDILFFRLINQLLNKNTPLNLLPMLQDLILIIWKVEISCCKKKLDEVLKIFEIPKQQNSRLEEESSDDESIDDGSFERTSESSGASTPFKKNKSDKPATRSGNLDSEDEKFLNLNIELKEENITETDPLSFSTSPI